MAGDEYGGPICFYDVLADHFVRTPQDGKPILDLIVQFWSQTFASNIFSLLFHKWVCMSFRVGFFHFSDLYLLIEVQPY